MFYQSVKMALGAIISNKLRSFLTMLGIIIGVVALVVLVSLVNSATTSITDEVANMGSDMLSVSVSDDKGNPLRLSDLTAMQEDDRISLTAPVGTLSVTADYSSSETTASVYGTTASYYDIRGLELMHGRFLKTTDTDNNICVAVLSFELAEELLGTPNAVGETVKLDGRSFQVVGVLTENDSAATSSNTMTAYIPYTTATRMSDSSAYVSAFYVSAPEGMTTDITEMAVEQILLSRFNSDEDAFTIMNSTVIADAMSSITGILTMVLGGIAAISLIVGGIGIMNIMLVSVTERTKEIGIRKAIGASTFSILSQFLIEALVLSLVGCMIGVAISWIIILAVAFLADGTLSFHMSVGVVLTAIVFSVAIGVLFGIYPARKAAKMNPIDALRYDT